jgi:hypothetical protein
VCGGGHAFCTIAQGAVNIGLSSALVPLYISEVHCDGSSVGYIGVQATGSGVCVVWGGVLCCQHDGGRALPGGCGHRPELCTRAPLHLRGALTVLLGGTCGCASGWEWCVWGGGVLCSHQSEGMASGVACEETATHKLHALSSAAAHGVRYCTDTRNTTLASP